MGFETITLEIDIPSEFKEAGLELFARRFGWTDGMKESMIDFSRQVVQGWIREETKLAFIAANLLQVKEKAAIDFEAIFEKAKK